jgi:hypothetical protein
MFGDVAVLGQAGGAVGHGCFALALRQYVDVPGRCARGRMLVQKVQFLDGYFDELAAGVYACAGC